LILNTSTTINLQPDLKVKRSAKDRQASDLDLVPRQTTIALFVTLRVSRPRWGR